MEPKRLDAPQSDMNAWCELLGLIHDEAKVAGEDFLAYLTGVALTHADSLRKGVGKAGAGLSESAERCAVGYED
jgi:hypothetical protein